MSARHDDITEPGPPRLEEVSDGIHAYVQPDGTWWIYIARWRSTCGLAAPYVIEDGGAAVMCETTIGGSALYAESTTWRSARVSRRRG